MTEVKVATEAKRTTVDSQVPPLDEADDIDINEPDAQDIKLAVRLVRLHCAAMQYPQTRRCLNCGWEFPCVSHRWGRKVLLAAGWTDREIAALDTRTGAWS